MRQYVVYGSTLTNQAIDGISDGLWKLLYFGSARHVMTLMRADA